MPPAMRAVARADAAGGDRPPRRASVRSGLAARSARDARRQRRRHGAAARSGARLPATPAAAPVRTLIVSSAEVYGIHRPERMPLDESAPLRPANPYAASKAAAEAIGLAWARSYGLDVVVARPFNHIGPGQDDAFRRRDASPASSRRSPPGGPRASCTSATSTAERDFLDVRDVAEAYVALLAYGAGGEVYNICSGHAVRIQEVLRQLITIAHVPVEVREDPERMRPSDLPILVGYASKLRAATGWEPRFTLTADAARRLRRRARARQDAVSRMTGSRRSKRSSSRSAARCSRSRRRVLAVARASRARSRSRLGLPLAFARRSGARVGRRLLRRRRRAAIA